jgi:ATP-dependent helicase/nuclease subunit A
MNQFKRALAQPGMVTALARPGMADGVTVELWRERSFAVRLADRLLEGRFDRVVVQWKQGRAVGAELVDFKTDRVDDGGANLPELIEQYRSQMQAYRAALAAMLGLSPGAIRTTLLFVATGDRAAVKS